MLVQSKKISASLLKKSKVIFTGKEEETYQALRRGIQRKQGFGLFFICCLPANVKQIIERIRADIPKQNVELLALENEIEHLYDFVKENLDYENIDILVITGIEKGLLKYIKPGIGGEGNYYNMDTVPQILGHLNLYRETFRSDFKMKFAFILPLFAYKYFIRRAPDFFDLHSGIFEFDEFPVSGSEIELDWSSIPVNPPDPAPQVQAALEETQEKEIQEKEEEKEVQLKEDKDFMKSRFGKDFSGVRVHTDSNAVQMNKQIGASAFTHGKDIFYHAGKYNPESSSGKELLAHELTHTIQSSSYNVEWNKRGDALSDLGRYEEAIASYDKALEINSHDDKVWNNRGVALDELGRYEEAIASYDKALEIRLNDDKAWNNRGITLSNLGRFEEAIASYDKALEINPNDDKVWNNRGFALSNLGRFEKALISYSQAIGIKPNYKMYLENCDRILQILKEKAGEFSDEEE